KPLCMQQMRRQLCSRKDRLDVLARNIGEGIELQPRAVLFHHGDLGAQAALKALAPIDPGIERFQVSRQRLDFADTAAGTVVGGPENQRSEFGSTRDSVSSKGLTEGTSRRPSTSINRSR